MNEIKLARNIGKKIFMLVVLGIMSFVVVFMITDILFVNIVNGDFILELVNIMIIGVISLSIYLFLCLLILSSSFTRLTEEGIWQFQLIRPVFIRWGDIQKIEARLGTRMIVSTQSVIQINLEDFKEPHKLVAAIEARVPSSALTETDSTDL